MRETGRARLVRLRPLERARGARLAGPRVLLNRLRRLQVREVCQVLGLSRGKPLQSSFPKFHELFEEPHHRKTTDNSLTACVLVLVLVLHSCSVTVSSTGAKNQLQGDDNGHVGRPCEVSPAPPFPEPL